MIPHRHAVILGAGAAGMMCAAAAGPGALVLDHAPTPGEKIRISGGGRCNFTNLHVTPEAFLSGNPHFAKSALARYTQWDFLALVEAHGIAWHEKTLGQLFCDDSALQIIAMLRAEIDKAGAEMWLDTTIDEIGHDGTRFTLRLTRAGRPVRMTCAQLVVATGGKSIPKIGATDLGYRLARQFGHGLVETRPGLVPLTFGGDFSNLSGLSVPARIGCQTASFAEGLLFTHRGLSGPSILQVSSYWREGQPITISLLPDLAFGAALRRQRAEAGRKDLATVLGTLMPRRLAEHRLRAAGLSGNLADQSDAKLQHLVEALTQWHLTPTGTEGYRKAEVTLGGVDTDGLEAKTLESRHVAGLFFIGEVVDVTGWLGGYNFQWAWASAVAAGRAIRQRG